MWKILAGRSTACYDRDHHRKYASYRSSSHWLFNNTCSQHTLDSTATNTSKWRYVIILVVTGIVEARTSQSIRWRSETIMLSCDVRDRYFIWFPFLHYFLSWKRVVVLPRLNVINQSHPLSKNSVNHSTTFEIRQCYRPSIFFPSFSYNFGILFPPRSTDHPMEADFLFRGKSSSIFGCAKLWNRKQTFGTYTKLL